jgi:hypothetical protein
MIAITNQRPRRSNFAMGDALFLSSVTVVTFAKISKREEIPKNVNHSGQG